MAGAGAGTQQGPPSAGEAGGLAPGHPAWRNWAGGVPVDVLAKVAETFVAQTEAGWAAHLRERPYVTEQGFQRMMARRKQEGNCCLFVFALVCKEWRKAQLKVGGPLRTRVSSDVLLPGSVALVEWALAEGCPREGGVPRNNMAHFAARYGQRELVGWLCGEGGFTMDEELMWRATRGGDLQLVQWLRGEGCPWDVLTCDWAVASGHVEVLRWLRENGCPWDAGTRDRAAAELGYTDDLGNLV